MTWQFQAPAVKPFGKQFADGWPTGMCTLFALAVCDIIAKSLPGDPASVMKVTQAIYDDCVKRGWCDKNGAATQWGMIQEAGFIGLPVLDRIPYNANLPEKTWHDFLLKYVARPDPYPVLLQFENGQALKDAISGQADEVGLQRHAGALYGTQISESLPGVPQTGGYLGADGDNITGWSRPVVYSLDTLRAARPSSLVVFDYVQHNTVVFQPPKPLPPLPPANDGDIDLPPNVAADLQKQLASTQALLNQIAATLKAAQH